MTAATQSDVIESEAGLWQAIWRQHRGAVVLCLAVVAAMGLNLMALALRMTQCRPIAADEPAPKYFGGMVCPGWWQVSDWRGLTGMALLVGAPVMGIVAGITVFAGDFERRTQVFALTQGVGRVRWWAAKLVMVGVPITVGWALVGAGSWWLTASYPLGFLDRSPLAPPLFEMLGPLPATQFLLAFVVTAVAGQVLRSTVLGLVAGSLVVLLVMVAGMSFRSDLVPKDRYTAPLLDYGSTGLVESAWQLRFGYLTSAGEPVEVPDQCYQALDGQRSDSELEAAWLDCVEQADIVSTYVDVIPDSRRVQLVSTVVALQLAFIAAMAAIGFAVIRRRDLI